jgi:hypothetical protein
LATTNWIPVGNAITGTGSQATFNLGTTNTQQFFRLVIQP